MNRVKGAADLKGVEPAELAVEVGRGVFGIRIEINGELAHARGRFDEQAAERAESRDFHRQVDRQTRRAAAAGDPRDRQHRRPAPFSGEQPRQAIERRRQLLGQAGSRHKLIGAGTIGFKEKFRVEFGGDDPQTGRPVPASVSRRTSSKSRQDRNGKTKITGSMLVRVSASPVIRARPARAAAIADRTSPNTARSRTPSTANSCSRIFRSSRSQPIAMTSNPILSTFNHPGF